MRIAQGRPISLSHTFLDDDEETALTLSAVSVTLADENGVTVATVDATDAGEGEWAASFAAQPIGQYVATWSTTAPDPLFSEVDYVEVVGNFLFTVKEARTGDLADAGLFSGAKIIDAREQVETEFQKIAGRSFTTRAVYYEFASDGTGEEWNLIPDAQAIETATVNGVAVTDLTGWAVSKLGKIDYPAYTYTTATGDVAMMTGDTIQVRVRYGFKTVPSDIARVALIRLRDLLNQESSTVLDRATTWQPTEGGTYRIAQAGSGPWETGIPEVDATVKRYRLDSVLSMYGMVGLG